MIDIKLLQLYVSLILQPIKEKRSSRIKSQLIVNRRFQTADKGLVRELETPQQARPGQANKRRLVPLSPAILVKYQPGQHRLAASLMNSNSALQF